jgi:lysophospholipase L1-like esterase
MKRAVLGVVLLFFCRPGLAQEFALRDGDRVVFYGDSITQEGQYARTVEAYVATRYPEWTISFRNAGVGGDKVNGGSGGSIEVRLQRDVIAHNPTLVTIMLGMNDGGYQAFDQATFDIYASGYRSIVTRLKDALPGVRLVLIQPSPYDDLTRPAGAEAYDSVLKRYAAFVQDLGREQGATVVDLHTPLLAGIEKIAKTNPLLARQMIPDRVHPSAAGHYVMAGALLRAWNAPAVVSRVELDAAASGARLVRAENTEVTGLAAKGPYLEWTQTDRALPLPLSFKDAQVELGELAGAGLEALDQQILKINGLSAGRYELLIDGVAEGRFSEVELKAGVNLAKEDTPMYKQAVPVRRAVNTRHELELARRKLAVADDPRLVEGAVALGVFDGKLQQDRRGLGKPAVHRYEVRRSYSLR